MVDEGGSSILMWSCGSRPASASQTSELAESSRAGCVAPTAPTIVRLRALEGRGRLRTFGRPHLRTSGTFLPTPSSSFDKDPQWAPPSLRHERRCGHGRRQMPGERHGFGRKQGDGWTPSTTSTRPPDISLPAQRHGKALRGCSGGGARSATTPPELAVAAQRNVPRRGAADPQRRIR